MIRGKILEEIESAMVLLGHNAPWYLRAQAALLAIRLQGAAVVDKRELGILQSTYGFDLPDLTEPKEEQ